MISDKSGSPSDDPNNAFDEVLNRVQQAGQQFINGDATAIKALWSHTDDVSIFGAGGGHGRGWEQVGPSLDGGATQFRRGDVSGHVDVDILARGVSGEVGFTIAIEHGEACMRGQENLTSLALRVTQIYRREAGTWKIIHRHADALTGRP